MLYERWLSSLWLNKITRALHPLSLTAKEPQHGHLATVTMTHTHVNSL